MKCAVGSASLPHPCPRSVLRDAHSIPSLVFPSYALRAIIIANDPPSVMCRLACSRLGIQALPQPHILRLDPRPADITGASLQRSRSTVAELDRRYALNGRRRLNVQHGTAEAQLAVRCDISARYLLTDITVYHTYTPNYLAGADILLVAHIVDSGKALRPCDRVRAACVHAVIQQKNRFVDAAGDNTVMVGIIVLPADAVVGTLAKIIIM